MKLAKAFLKEKRTDRRLFTKAFPKLFAKANNTRPRVCENKRSIRKRTDRRLFALQTIA